MRYKQIQYRHHHLEHANGMRYLIITIDIDLMRSWSAEVQRTQGNNKNIINCFAFIYFF